MKKLSLIMIKKKHEHVATFVVFQHVKQTQPQGQRISSKDCGKLGHEEANYHELIRYLTGWNTRERHVCLAKGAEVTVDMEITTAKVGKAQWPGGCVCNASYSRESATSTIGRTVHAPALLD